MLPCERFVTRNIHVQYKSPITSGLKVMIKIKAFQKKEPHLHFPELYQ